MIFGISTKEEGKLSPNLRDFYYFMKYDLHLNVSISYNCDATATVNYKTYPIN